MAAAGVVLSLLAGACGGGGGAAAGKAIPAADATALAARADRIAAELAGGQCDQAKAETQSLQADLGTLAVPAALRDEAVAGAARLAGAITCAPPAPVTTLPPVADQGDSGPTKGKKHKGGGAHAH